MLKNIMVFEYGNDEARICMQEMLDNDTLMDAMLIEPAQTNWRSIGVIHPVQFGNELVYDNGTGIRALAIGLCERQLPSTIIKRATAFKVDELSRLEGRVIGRKETAQIKESVVLDLLPKAFVKHSSVLILITKNHLIIDTPSVKVADEIISFLVDTCLEEHGRMMFFPLTNKLSSVSNWLKDLALDDDSGNFVPMSDIHIRTMQGGNVRIKDIDVHSENVQSHLGFTDNVVKAMRLGFRSDTSQDSSDVSFIINDAGLIKGVKFPAEIASGDDGAEGVCGRFDADINLVTGIVLRMLGRLNDALRPAEGEDEL
jgi:recombination associated protein RdgC